MNIIDIHFFEPYRPESNYKDGTPCIVQTINNSRTVFDESQTHKLDDLSRET